MAKSGERRHVVRLGSPPTPRHGASAPTFAMLDLWRFDLDAPPVPPAVLGRYLAPHEKERAARFRSPQDRRRWTTGHGLLRHLLGALVGRSPSALVYEHGPHGKPGLPASATRAPLVFNASDTDRLMVVLTGDASTGPVGVDVEVIRHIPDLDQLAERILSSGEARRTPPDAFDGSPEALARFYRIWTAKEAFLKASGAGLSVDPEQIEVEFVSAERFEIDASEGVAAGGSIPDDTPRRGRFLTLDLPGTEETVSCAVVAARGLDDLVLRAPGAFPDARDA